MTTNFPMDFIDTEKSVRTSVTRKLKFAVNLGSANSSLKNGSTERVGMGGETDADYPHEELAEY